MADVDLSDYSNDHPAECTKCPHSLICMTGRDAQARLIERWFCDRCSRYWVRPTNGHSYRCTRNMGTFNIDPRPWVCWDCVERAMAKEIDAKQAEMSRG